jgi:UDP-N-acetylmuramoylalanine--D-glutamate ligase
VLVLGLGRHGGAEGAVRYLAEGGAEVVVYDRQSAGTLRTTLDHLQDLALDVTLLGTAAEDVPLDGWDLVVRNPAIPIEADVLNALRSHGVPIHTEASLFVEDFPGTVIGITGTKGKTSTAFYLHHLLGGQDRQADVCLAGNMGGSALEVVAAGTSESVAVVELSSFQTETIAERELSVPVACLTNVQEDHLDRYGNKDRYWQAKAGLFTSQGPTAWRVHTADLPTGLLGGAQSRWCCVFTDDPDAEASVWIASGSIHARMSTGPLIEVLSTSELPIEDEHRLDAVVVALAAALLQQVPVDDLRTRLRTLPVVPHRMEALPVPGPTTWINDTTATTPTSAAAAIRAQTMKGTLTVLVGGAPKGLSLEPLLDALTRGACSIVLLSGEESSRLAVELRRRGLKFDGPATDMADAVRRGAAYGTDIVMLSPGCASFATNGHPGFDDEFHRGAMFTSAVLRLHGIKVDDALRRRLADPRRRTLADELSMPGE